MKHRLRRAGHECDRFVVQGLECPFAKIEEEEDDEDEEEETPDPKERVPVREFPQIDPGIPIFIPARRRPGLLIQQALDAVAKVEAEKALERVGQIQEIGGLKSIPTLQDLRGALSGPTAQGIMAVLAALAITAALGRMPAMRSAMPSLAVASSERRVAQRFSMLSVPQEKVKTAEDRSNVRKLFGFGPTAGFDSFSETGFN